MKTFITKMYNIGYNWCFQPFLLSCGTIVFLLLLAEYHFQCQIKLVVMDCIKTMLKTEERGVMDKASLALRSTILSFSIFGKISYLCVCFCDKNFKLHLLQN